ncbi:hypothetical protein Cni_G26645 [Canna indica]|uniref:Uncharacterized protein n=1 Tax=Canna indica TaxID=4628 RepID=A0AAQ3L6L4_9LILI|nr:hypothetical protein Cni_G26645 [Canna indica]
MNSTGAPSAFITTAEVNRRNTSEFPTQKANWDKNTNNNISNENVSVNNVDSLQTEHSLDDRNVCRIFCDAAWLNEDKATGIGFQIYEKNNRDSQNYLSFMLAVDPLSAELWAIWLSLVKARQMNIKHIKVFFRLSQSSQYSI